MEKTCPILLGGQTVGQASVIQEGLYLHISCACRFSGEMLYKITLTSGDYTEELGIPVPSEGRFRLRTSRPAKRFEGNELVFCASPKHNPLTGRFVPLKPEEPFAYITQLQNAFLEVRGGQVGLVIPTEEI